MSDVHDHNTIIIKWQGPYNYSEIEALKDKGNGLYLASGKVKYQREDSFIQYCGITEGSFFNRLKKHHKIWEINREQEFWLGELLVPNATRHFLEMAEKLIIYFWQPNLNNRKKVLLPKSTTVINYWFKKDGSPRKNQMNIYRELPDVLSWDGEHWRTGNLSVYEDY